MHLSIHTSRLLRKVLLLGLLMVCGYSIWYNLHDAGSILSTDSNNEELKGYVDDGTGKSADFLFRFSTAMTMFGDPLLPESGTNTLSHHTVFSTEKEVITKYIFKLCFTHTNSYVSQAILIKQTYNKSIISIDCLDFIIMERQLRV